MNKVDFPEVPDTMDCGEYRHYIMDWFKRMIGDFPFERVDWDHQRFLRVKGYYNSAVNPYVAGALETWFEKWFSQFIEKDDKDD